MKLLPVFFLLLMLAGLAMFEPVSLQDEKNDHISVTVGGAVEEEKILSLERYATVEDLFREVELKENADAETLNPRTVLKDGDCIIIPEKKEEARISINTASAEELIRLPGIGPATAEKIIRYREENGLFQTLEDLKNVKGIGPVKFARLQDLITL